MDSGLDSEKWQLPLEHQTFFYTCFNADQRHGYMEKISSLFSSGQEFDLELGAGKGDFLIHSCKDQPERVLGGVEKKWSRCRVMARKLFSQRIPNGFVIQGLIETILAHGFGVLRFRNIYMNYPDPWPKKKHQRRRTTRTPDFFANIHRNLAAGGLFTFCSDCQEYVHEVALELKKSPGFLSIFSEDVVESLPDYHSTLFEQYAIKDGLKPLYLCFRRTA